MKFRKGHNFIINVNIMFEYVNKFDSLINTVW